MKIRPGETMESWASRVEMFEKGRAMQRIANGDDPATVMEDMSRRITDKLLHPILNAIRESVPNDFDVEKNRREYEEIMKNVEKAADHVDTSS
jgi:glutamyl-tRNA reductase